MQKSVKFKEVVEEIYTFTFDELCQMLKRYVQHSNGEVRLEVAEGFVKLIARVEQEKKQSYEKPVHE